MPNSGNKYAKELVQLLSDSKSLGDLTVQAQINQMLDKMEALPQEEIDGLVNNSHPQNTLLTALFSRGPPSEFDISSSATYTSKLLERLTDPHGKFKCDINQLDKNGVAPLHFATQVVGQIYPDSTVLLKMLLDHPKINTSLPSATGETMVSLAVKGKSFALIKEIVERGVVSEFFEQRDTSKNLNCNYFQTLYLYSQNGNLRRFFEGLDSENARIIKREGDASSFPANDPNFDSLLKRHAIKMLFVKKNDEDVPFSWKRVYFEEYPSSEIYTEQNRITSEFESKKAKLESDFNEHKERISANMRFAEKFKTQQLAALEEEKVQMLKTYEEEYQEDILKLQEKYEKNKTEVSLRDEIFERIIADPRDFLAKNRDEQQAYLVENFKEQYLPDLDDLLKVFVEKAEILDKISVERKEVAKVKEMKIQGHRLGLKGKFDYQNGTGTESYEGMNGYNTASAISQRVYQFNDVIQTKTTSPYVQPESFTDPEKKAMQIVADSFKELDRAFDNDNYIEQARRYNKGLPIIIPCHWDGHLASAVLYKDKLYISNKGWGSLVPSVTCYQINVNKLDKDPVKLAETIKQLSLETRPSKPWYRAAGEMLDSNLDLPALQALEPKVVYRRPLQGQKQGTCAYTNLKRATDAILMALKDDAHAPKVNDELDSTENQSKKCDDFKEIDNVKIFKAFTKFDRLQGIDACIARYQSTKDMMHLDPLFQYLATKPEHSHKNSISTAQHIVQHLQALPEMGQGKWEQHVIQRKYPPSLVKTKISDGSQHLQSALFMKGAREDSIKRLFYIMIPGGQRYTRNRALEEAGMAREALPRSNLQGLMTWIEHVFFKPSENELKKELEREKSLGPVSPLYVSKKEKVDASMGQVSPLYTPKEGTGAVESAKQAEKSQVNGARKPCITPGFRGSKPEERLQSFPSTGNQPAKAPKNKSGI